MAKQMREPVPGVRYKSPYWRWAVRLSWPSAHGHAQNKTGSTSVHSGRLSLLLMLPLLHLLLLLSEHNLAALASDTDADLAPNVTIDSKPTRNLTETINRTTAVNDLKENVEERASGQLATRMPPLNTDASDEDAVISASEILSDPVVMSSTRSDRLLERVVFGSRHDDASNGAQTPLKHENGILLVPNPTRPPIIHSQPESDEFESMSQQTSRIMLQMFLFGLMIFVTLALCIVYAIKFCLCRRRKAARMLMRRALVGDLATGQQAIGSISRPTDNFVLTECVCHHQHNPQLAPAHLNDCIDGYHYFSGAAHAVEPVSPSQNRNSMILTLIQRLQQTLAAATNGDNSRVTQPVDSNQQQLAELIAAQLIACGCLQNTCLCQQHHLTGQVPIAPTQRPPAYHELFRQQQQHQHQQNQRQVSPSAPPQQVTTRGGADTASSRSTTSDQDDGADRREL